MFFFFFPPLPFFFLLYINPPYSSDIPVDYLWDVWDSREEGSGWGKRLVGTLKAVWCRPAVHFVAIPASSILVIVLDNDYTRAWCHAFSFSTASVNYFLRLFKPGTALKARFRESLRSVSRPSARVSTPTSCQYRCFYLGCRNAMHAYCQFYFYLFFLKGQQAWLFSGFLARTALTTSWSRLKKKKDFRVHFNYMPCVCMTFHPLWSWRLVYWFREGWAWCLCSGHHGYRFSFFSSSSDLLHLRHRKPQLFFFFFLNAIFIFYVVQSC